MIEKRLALSDAYKLYAKRGGTLSEKVYNSVVRDFNERAMEEVFKGKVWDLGSNLSAIWIARFERTFKRRRIDWNASNKLKAELLAEGKTLFSKENQSGEMWLVYCTDDDYYRFFWNKIRANVSNKTAYSFRPTEGPNGNKKKLIRLLKSTPISYRLFKLHTY